MIVTIDRFEGIYAVCEKEDRTMIDIKRINIPKSAKEGDILNVEGNSITINKEEIERRRKEIEDLSKDLWK